MALGGFVLFPLVELGREVIAAGWDAIWATFDTAARTAIRNTIWTSVAATVLTLALALAVAIPTSRFGRRGRLFVLGAMVLPMLVPPFVSALSWGAAYGPGGLLDDLFGVELPGLFGPAGVVMLLVASALPIAYLIVAAALESQRDHDRVRAARVAGATGADALRTVTLPLLRPALVAAGAVTFVMSSNAFGVPAVLGTPAGFSTATTRLYRDLVLSADPVAFDRVLVLAAALAVITLVVVGSADAKTGSPVRWRVEPSGPGLGDAGSGVAPWAIGAFVLVVTAVPSTALILSSLTRGVGLAPVPANWTLEHYRDAWSAGAGPAFLTSLVLAAAAATLVVVLGGVLVALERRRRSGSGTLAAMAFAVPGSVLAVAVLLAYGPWLRDTLSIILIAFVAKFWALGHRPIAGSADALPPELLGAARVNGATPVVALRSVVVPLLRPALVAAWLVVLMFGLHELTISSLLHGPGTETLAVVVLDLQQLGAQAATAALAVLLTAGATAVAVPLLPLWRRTSRSAT